MLLLDITIVNVALPDIQTELDASLSDLQWVIDAYALSLAALLLTAGSLADLFGRRRVFVIGLVLFTLGSVACGAAQDIRFAHRGPGLPGHRRRGDVRHRPRPARRRLPRQGPRRGLRRLRRDHRRRRRHRPGARRRADQRPVVALDLLRQHPDLRRSPSRSRCSRCGVEGPPRRPPRLDRLRDLRARPRRARLRPDRGRPAGLGRQPRRRSAWSPRPCCWSSSWSARSCSASRCSTSRCCASRPSPAAWSRRSASRRRSSRCWPSWSSTSRTSSTTPRSAPACASCSSRAPRSSPRRIAGRLTEQVPVKWLIGPGFLILGVGLVLLLGIQDRLVVDPPDPGPDRLRRRHRADQPAAGLDRGRRGRARALRHGLRGQLDLPPGRHRHRHRRPRLDLRPPGRRRRPPRARRQGARPGPRRPHRRAVRRPGQRRRGGCPEGGRAPAAAAAGQQAFDLVNRVGTSAVVDALNHIVLIAAVIAFAAGRALPRADPAEGLRRPGRCASYRRTAPRRGGGWLA